jgi:hypothetical protein
MMIIREFEMRENGEYVKAASSSFVTIIPLLFDALSTNGF